ncbi:unnamed protein product [Lampetra planeri]
MGSILVKMFLPTISGLAFLPTVSIAAKRRFHIEAMVYFFTMFFITCYHVCDGLGFLSICIMRSELLEYFSVYGIALSIWVTLIALGEFEEPQRLAVVMAGVLGIAVRVSEDSWGTGVYAGPVVAALLLLALKHTRKMIELRAFLPSRKVYTHHLGPGICFLVLAFTLRFYFQEWDYPYVHSFFHCCLSAACVILLPRSSSSSVAQGNQQPDKLSCYTLCCCV